MKIIFMCFLFISFFSGPKKGHFVALVLCSLLAPGGKVARDCLITFAAVPACSHAGTTSILC